jgi:inner membrane protein
MDSLTQIVLGASVGAAIMGKTHGRKAALVGAICGTIPDLDALIPMGDPISNMTYHRGFSHSFLFCIFATPLFVWLFSKIKWFAISMDDKRVHLAVFLIFLTHVLLDAMTIYGTQLFWPLPVEPVGIGSIFIIDPLYTIPFLVFLIWFLINKSQRAVHIGLIISTLYLGWSVIAQNHVYKLVEKDGKTAGKILVQPTAFNTILWRVLVVQDDAYHVGYYSLFDDTTDMVFETFERDTNQLPDTWAVDRLRWFTKGFYGVRQIDDQIIMSDLRMGMEPNQYVFQFIVSDDPVTQYRQNRDMSRVELLWDRMVRDF